MKKIERKTGRATSGSSSAAKPKPAAPSNKAVTESPDNLNLAEIKALIELVSDKQFNEFELERGNFKLRLSKGLAKAAAFSEPVTVVEQKVVATPVAAPQPVAPAPVIETPPPAKEEENLHIVTSPIVGTFYGSPNPSSPAFVAVGDSVQTGKVLCIVEAMKLMNEVVSDASGVIAKVFAENGQPVEYGQPLFGIKK